MARTLPRMSRSLVERRLTEVSARLRQLREELAVSDEQLQHLAQRHADAMQRHRAELIEAVTRLEQTQDDLLDRLLAESK